MKFAKFQELALGFEARRKVDLPLLNGTVVAVDVVAVPTFEIIDIESDACKFAEKKGVVNPKPGQPIYDRALHMYTVLRTCLDHDVREKQERFFESLDQIGNHLDPDRVAFLYHHQRAWQEKISPLGYGDLSPEKFIEMGLSMAYGGEEDFSLPFDNSPRRTQLSFVRQLARAYFGLLSHKSTAGSLSADEETNSKSSSENETPVAPPPPSSPTPSPAPSCPAPPSAAEP
jgi:hypothetical protein